MRIQKLRGGHRKAKTTARWVRDNHHINSTILAEFNKTYVKVSPWRRLSIINSVPKSPRGQIRYLIVEGLLDIYLNWKSELDKTGKPYYLKIWLSIDKIEESQVVCAVADKVSYYDYVFDKTEKEIPIPVKQFGSLTQKITSFRWQSCVDYAYYAEEDLTPQIIKQAKKVGDSYRIKTRTLWVGGLKQ